MNKKFLKFLVKHKFVKWAPLLDEIVTLSNTILCLSDATHLFPVLKTKVSYCAETCNCDFIYIVTKHLLSKKSQKYLYKQFLKEYYRYSKYFVGKIILNANLSTFVPEIQRSVFIDRAAILKNTVKPLNSKKIITTKLPVI